MIKFADDRAFFDQSLRALTGAGDGLIDAQLEPAIAVEFSELLDIIVAAARVLNVPRFLRFPVFGFFFREYKRYPPDLSFLIMISGH